MFTFVLVTCELSEGQVM